MAAKKNPDVTMRVKIGDSELEVRGPSDFVEKKISEFMGNQKISRNSTTSSPTKEITAQPSPSSMNKDKTASLPQLFRKTTAKSDIDKTLIAGYYLGAHKKFEKFTANEIRQAFKDARVPPPKNPNDAIAKNIKKGFMMSAGDKDGLMGFVLTTDGEDAILELQKQ